LKTFSFFEKSVNNFDSQQSPENVWLSTITRQFQLFFHYEKMIFTSLREEERSLTKNEIKKKFQQTLDASMMSTAERTNFKTIF